MHYLTVSEIANALNVTPQGVNKFLREQGLQSQAVKKGNKFLIDENLAETIRNHFRPNEQDILKQLYQTETVQETSETVTETTETETETDGNGKSPVQTDIFKAKIEQLEIRLKEKDSEIVYLRNELKESIETQKQLAAQNMAFTTKYLVESTQEQEKESVIEVKPQEQEGIIAADVESIADEPKKQDITLDEYLRMGFFERLKYKWGRDNVN